MFEKYVFVVSSTVLIVLNSRICESPSCTITYAELESSNPLCTVTYTKILIADKPSDSTNNIVAHLCDQSFVAASELDHRPTRLSLHIEVRAWVHSSA